MRMCMQVLCMQQRLHSRQHLGTRRQPLQQHLTLVLLSWQASSALLRMGAIWWYAMSAVQLVRCFQNSLICFRRGSLVLMRSSSGRPSPEMSHSRSSPTAVTPHGNGSTCGATEHHWGRPGRWQRAGLGQWRQEACLLCKSSTGRGASAVAAAQSRASGLTAADNHSHWSRGLLTSLGDLAALDGRMQQPEVAWLRIKTAACQQAVAEHGQVVAPATQHGMSAAAYKGLRCIVSCGAWAHH